MQRLLFLLTSMLFTGAAIAAPVINKAVLDSTGIVITGKNFGAENPMLFWDDVKNTYRTQHASEGDEVVASSTSMWKEKTNIWGKPFTFSESVKTKSGRKDVVYYGEGHKNFLGTPNHEVPKELSHEMFVSWWYMPGKSPAAEGGSNKFIRIWDDGNGKGTRISWTHMHLTCDEVVTWGNWKGNVGEWNHHMIYVNLHANSVKTWVNGSLIHDGKCEKHPDFQNKPLYVQLVGFDHGSNAYRDMTTSIDDIYIGRSQARVEISSSPKWSATMPKELVPIASWSDTKIVTRLHDGKVKLSSDMYVYVVDKSGAVNVDGIKATCTGCPKADFK